MELLTIGVGISLMICGFSLGRFSNQRDFWEDAFEIMHLKDEKNKLKSELENRNNTLKLLENDLDSYHRFMKRLLEKQDIETVHIMIKRELGIDCDV
jgi:hypothetical protein